ncbi:AraC family ligand binding domain-containing protein [Acetobacterium woodii]|uniref:Transcriptional regulator AraC family n=1 Tax=Acetobacterium woodii (strain ATCC 29683 / DSM 1030 / JCM 2381 / KCTC 1655 / WB1) TaxID=931626 RepID=H6LEC4_ACEWD|nr:AraC family ligand binding domain-containing protein [Acetobacterium woodii]AFA46838.1 transcriptional regulator AraC family [Acetobacterium woodii DSM 1030]
MERTLLKKLKWLPESIEEQNIIYDSPKKGRDELEYVILKSVNLIRQNEMVHFYKLEPDRHIPKHGHDFIEVFYTCKGIVQHIIQGNIVNVKKGELLFMSQNTVHEINPVSEEDVGVYFAFVPEFFHQINAMMEIDNTVAEFIFNSLLGSDKKTSYFHFQTATNKRIHNLIENMIEIILSGKQSSMKLLQNTMLLIFLEMIESFEESYKNEMKQINGGNVMEVINYINQNYKNASLSELSKEMHISVAYLSQMIKKTQG